MTSPYPKQNVLIHIITPDGGNSKDTHFIKSLRNHFNSLKSYKYIVISELFEFYGGDSEEIIRNRISETDIFVVLISPNSFNMLSSYYNDILTNDKAVHFNFLLRDCPWENHIFFKKQRTKGVHIKNYSLGTPLSRTNENLDSILKNCVQQIYEIAFSIRKEKSDYVKSVKRKEDSEVVEEPKYEPQVKDKRPNFSTIIYLLTLLLSPWIFYKISCQKSYNDSTTLANYEDLPTRFESYEEDFKDKDNFYEKGANNSLETEETGVDCPKLYIKKKSKTRWVENSDGEIMVPKGLYRSILPYTECYTIVKKKGIRGIWVLNAEGQIMNEEVIPYPYAKPFKNGRAKILDKRRNHVGYTNYNGFFYKK